MSVTVLGDLAVFWLYVTVVFFSTFLLQYTAISNWTSLRYI